MHRLIAALRYCEIRFATDRKKNDTQIGEEMGMMATQAEAGVALIKRDKDMLKVASAIIGEMYLAKLADNDTRAVIMDFYQKNFMKWVTNMSNLASGSTGAPARDQVSAFRALQEGEVGLAFVKSLFTENDDGGETPEETHIKKMQELRSGPILRLANPVEGEVVG